MQFAICFARFGLEELENVAESPQMLVLFLRTILHVQLKNGSLTKVKMDVQVEQISFF